MGRSVFVLRPEPGLSATMDRGRSLGLAMEAMPLSGAEPVGWTLPEGAFDGILLGSANGLRHAGEGLEKLTGLPVYAVGAATAREAQERGFPIAQVGKGGLQKLVDALPPDRPLRLLRLAGEEHLPLHAPAHVHITTATIYRIVHHALTEGEVARLRQGGIVLLHSGAVASHFSAECDRTGVDRGAIALAALAPRIARSVSDGWQSVAVAAEPDDAALLSLAADMCH